MRILLNGLHAKTECVGGRLGCAEGFSASRLGGTRAGAWRAEWLKAGQVAGKLFTSAADAPWVWLFAARDDEACAQSANLADFSDVALLKRLCKSKDWLHALCGALFAERKIDPVPPGPIALRMIDSTLVKEPGQTGSQWRIHYSLQWPGLKCDCFKLTATKGEGTGESLVHYHVGAFLT